MFVLEAVMKTHQIVYIIENNCTVRPVEIIKLVGNFAIVKFNNGGGIQVSTKRLYETEKVARKAISNKTKENRALYNANRMNSSKYNAQML